MMDEHSKNIEKENVILEEPQKNDNTNEEKTVDEPSPKEVPEVLSVPAVKTHAKKSPFITPIAIGIVLIVIIGAILIILGNNGSSGSWGHTHIYEEWDTITEATCSNEGLKERYCTCGEKQTATINKINHEYGDWIVTKDASCTSTGLKERICDCGDIQSTVTEKTSHNLYETITKPATSTSTGTKTSYCYNCDYSSTTNYSAAILSSEEVYALAELCVGEITIYNKSGSAIALGTVFVYSADGKLITNYHVIDGAYSAKVTLNEKSYTVSSILAYDKDIDLAVLKINASNLHTPTIQTEGIKGGSKVYAVGSSEGYTLSFSTGVIASPSRSFDGVEYIQHEAAISHGNSGGPLFNQYGEVIGINTLTNIDGQNLNFAISCNELDNLYFGSSLTMKQFYEKECNPFEQIKNYVIENGTYDYSDNDYSLLLDSTYYSGYTYKTMLSYNVNDDELMFSIHINGEYSTGFWVDSKLSGSYTWMYLDDYGYEMMGTITARTYTDNTLLGYSYNNINSSSIRSSVRELASSMVDLILGRINAKIYTSVGVSAYDLGFTSF